MIEFTLGMAVAVTLAYFYTRRLRVEATLHRTATDELMLLRARLRAVQDRGTPVGKDMVYTIQQPNGRFGKFTLPRV